MCTHNEVDNVAPHHIEWCYGLYMGTRKVAEEEAEKYGWTPRKEDVILHNNRVQAFDHYWFIERVS